MDLWRWEATFWKTAMFYLVLWKSQPFFGLWLFRSAHPIYTIDIYLLNIKPTPWGEKYIVDKEGIHNSYCLNWKSFSECRFDYTFQTALASCVRLKSYGVHLISCISIVLLRPPCNDLRRKTGGDICNCILFFTSHQTESIRITFYFSWQIPSDEYNTFNAVRQEYWNSTTFFGFLGLSGSEYFQKLEISIIQFCLKVEEIKVK